MDVHITYYNIVETVQKTTVLVVVFIYNISIRNVILYYADGALEIYIHGMSCENEKPISANDVRAPKSHRSMAVTATAVTARSVRIIISSATRRHGLKRSAARQYTHVLHMHIQR